MRLTGSAPQLLLVAGLTALQLGDSVSETAERQSFPPVHTSPTNRSRVVSSDVLSQVSRGRQASVPQAVREPGNDQIGIHAFQFTRAIYTGFRRRGWGGRSWAVDYPKADRQFLFNLVRMTNIDAYQLENPVRLDDPELRKFPFLYVLEVGFMALTPPEVEGLRNYLLAGGFLFVDDFWGDREWFNFEREIRQVLPEFSIQELPLDHPAFSAFYDIDSIVQVPNVGNGTRGGPTYEKGGFTPHVRAIFDDNDRLIVLINWNTDLGDAWEWADNPYYPLKYSNFAWQLAINFIIYSMSH